MMNELNNNDIYAGSILTGIKNEIPTPVLNENDEIIELGEDFDFNGFQVVRREFFAHMQEPSVTFNNCKFYVNTACLKKFAEYDYAQVLINRQNKILALRPCLESARDISMELYVKRKAKTKTDNMQVVFCKNSFYDGMESELQI